MKRTGSKKKIRNRNIISEMRKIKHKNRNNKFRKIRKLKKKKERKRKKRLN